MRRSLLGWFVAAVLAIGGTALAYVFWFAGGSGEPTTDLTTPDLAASSTTLDDSDATDVGNSTTVPEQPEGASFVIDQTRSTARFEIDEVLNGSPKHVVGTTDQVVGQVRFDPEDLRTAEFSEIIVNARTLTTDSERRDRAMRGPVILNSSSDEHELITFTVTSVDGLEGAASVGETMDFTINGDLVIKGTTQAVSFDATITMVDEGTLEGTATTEITRDMFVIGIPSVPNVADVTNEVLIGIDFVATTG